MIRALLLTIAIAANAQTPRGEQIFVQSCSTGYCHGARGAGAGAPRLAARGFDEAFIRNTVSNGIAGTSMPAFAKSLSPGELSGVIAYVSDLNGVTSTMTKAGPVAKLPPHAAKGEALFSDATKSFGRCSACHLVRNRGIAVAAPIHNVPVTVAALKSLKTPRVVTASVNGESMPGLVVAKKSTSVTFYDLTTPPPVFRTVAPGEFSSTDSSTWQHASVTGAYSDAELAAVLAFLRVAK